GACAGLGVAVVRQVLPALVHYTPLCRSAELAFGADLTGHAGDFGSKGAELVHHGVDGVLEFQDFAFDIHRDFAGEVSFGHGGGDIGDVADLRGEVAGHGVDAVGQVLPGAADAFDLGLAAELAFGADFAGHAGDFGGERVQLVHH